MVLIFDIPQYIQLSAKQKPKYYYADKAIPKSFRNRFDIGVKDNKLYNTITNEFLVKNVKLVGKPRLEKINGQKIYNGKFSKFTRAKVVKKLHEFYTELLRDVDIKYNILSIHYIRFGDIESAHTQDNTQLFFLLIKCFEDTLTELGIIQSDHPKYARKSSIEFHHSEELDNKLIVILKEHK